MSIEAMEQALVALEHAVPKDMKQAKEQLAAINTLRNAIQQAQQPATGEPVAQWQKRHPVRTGGRWINTDEHDAKWWSERATGWEARALYTHSAQSVFLVRDIASLLGASVPDVCNALAELGYEPRRSTNAAISPDEALAVASRLHPAPSVPDDVVRDAISTVREHYRGTDWGKAAECICDAIDAAMLAAK